jgi:hypothetical protein
MKSSQVEQISAYKPDTFRVLKRQQIRRMKSQLACLLLLLTCLRPSQGAPLPYVPGATTTVYATNVLAAQAMDLAFDGTMYVSRDPGTGYPVKIWRIGKGGTPVTEFGSRAIGDPDGLILDRQGVISGEPGSILIGAWEGLVKVATNGNITVLITNNSSLYGNPNFLVFDKNERLLWDGLWQGASNNAVVSANVSGPYKLCDVPGIGGLAVDSANRIVVSQWNNPDVSLFTSSGNPITNRFFRAMNGSPLYSANGGFWGTDIYALGTNGDLLRVDLSGRVKTVGSGFETRPGVTWMLFAWDGNLYVNEYYGHRILKITPDETLRMTVHVSCIDVCWNSMTNKTYQVQWQPALPLSTNTIIIVDPPLAPSPAGEWFNLNGPVEGNGSTLCVRDDSVSTTEKRFYRVQELPSSP